MEDMKVEFWRGLSWDGYYSMFLLKTFIAKYTYEVCRWHWIGGEGGKGMREQGKTRLEFQMIVWTSEIVHSQ